MDCDQICMKPEEYNHLKWVKYQRIEKKINADRVNRITNEINFIEEQLTQPEDPEQLPLFQEGVRFEGEANTSEKIKLKLIL